MATLQYLECFHRASTWIGWPQVYTCPLWNWSPLSTSLLTPALHVAPEHQPWVTCFTHHSCTGHLFHIINMLHCYSLKPSHPCLLPPSPDGPRAYSIEPSKSERQWHPTPVLLPGKSQGQRSLVDCSPRGREESDTTERLHFPFSLSCIREGNGSPLQCSCLENPRDGEPGGLPSMGLHRVGHDWSGLAAAAAAASQKEKDTQPLLTHRYGIYKDGTKDPTYRAAKETKM